MNRADFIGQKRGANGSLLYAPWLVQGRYFDWWKSLGHRVVRYARPEDGALPRAINGDLEWAVPISNAIKFEGEAVAAEAQVKPPEEAPPPGEVVAAASAKPIKKRKKKLAEELR